jgi:hypothetical protein
MARFIAPIDLTGNELRNARTQNLPTAPATPGIGLRYFDTALTLERYWNGTRWVSLNDTINASNVTGLGNLAFLNQVTGTEIANGSIVNAHVSASAAIALSKLATDPLARANHTGTQLASTVSNFDAQVRTSRLDQMAVPTAPVSFGSQRLTNVATPTSASEAANKAYVDTVATGLDVKDSVRAASTANVTVTAPGAAIDGVTLVAGDRVLLKNQTALPENGIYVWNGAAVAMTRAPDADVSAEVTSGLFVHIVAGTVNAATGYVLTTPDPIVLGTTGLTFSQFSGAGAAYVGTANRITVTGNQIDIAATYTGQASITTVGTIATGTWQGTAVGIAYGGTGATTAAAARTNLGTTGKYVATIGDGSALYTVTHSLNTMDVVVELYDANAPNQTVYADIDRVSVNAIRVSGFTTNPTAGTQLKVVVVG